MARVYQREFKISETFPVDWGDRWNVRERGKVVEKWEVTWVDDKHRSFNALITELEPDENAVYY
jgi:hypothetical protein